MLNKSEIQGLVSGLSQRLNTPPEQILSNIENGNLSSIVNKMNSSQAQKLQSILNDPEQSQRVLNTPQAKAILKKLMG